MSLLTGKQIRREIERGRINIDPFDPARMNPNSYNLCLSEELLVYEKNYPIHAWSEQQVKRTGLWHPPVIEVEPLDIKVKEPTVSLKIPKDGLWLFPGVLYLAATIETAGANVFVPCIEGRSSVGRFGICVHVTAGFGDLNFGAPECPATWTMEVTVVHPIKVYAGFEVCQVVFTTPYQDDDLGELPRYEGKYTSQRGPKASGLWKDFLKKE